MPELVRAFTAMWFRDGPGGANFRGEIMAKITKRTVDALRPGEKEVLAWDDELKGFGVRMQPSGIASYLVKYRTAAGAQRKFAFARVGVATPDQARDKARKLLAEVADGKDPSAERHAARKALRVSELLDLYFEAATAGKVLTRRGVAKRGSTLEIDKGRAERHIRPLLGSNAADSVSRADVQRMVDAIASGKTAGTIKTKSRGVARVEGGAGTAKRAVGLLSGIFSWALDKQMLQREDNPCSKIRTQADGKKDRVLSVEELKRLGAACRSEEERAPMAVAALRLIALTGLRRSEAFGLRWAEVDAAAQCLRLEQSKTGKSVRVVSRKAMDVILAVPKTTSPFVFPSRNGKAPASLAHPVGRLFEAAGISDAGLHDLRRTFASIGADMELADSTLSALLGHAARNVTTRHYVRRSDATLISAADMIASAIARAMEGTAAEIVALETARRA
jgi:integrase